jgi:hypothetical protein
VLLVVCLAGEGEWDRARDVLSQVTAEQPEAVLTAAEQCWKLGLKRPPAQRSSLAALGQLLIDRLAERAHHMPPEQQLRWNLSRARLLALEGRTDQAAHVYRNLLDQQPDQVALRREFAHWLGERDDNSLRGEAQQLWREIVDRSAPYSPSWWEAKYQIARLHESLGQAQQGLEMIRLLQVLAPDMGGEQMRGRFEELERRCRERQP